MAREAALAFFDKVREDQTLRWRLQKSARTDVKSMLRFAAEAGYFFSLRDYQAALEAEGELSEAARLEIASGRYVIPGVTATTERDQP